MIRDPSVTGAMMIDEMTALACVGGDRDVLREVKDLLARETPVLVQAMTDAVAAEDWAALGTAAHSCKGMYLVFSPNPVEVVAAELESLGGGGDKQTAEQLLRQLSHAIREVHDALHAF